jgi:hypothetical protein
MIRFLVVKLFIELGAEINKSDVFIWNISKPAFRLYINYIHNLLHLMIDY